MEISDTLADFTVIKEYKVVGKTKGQRTTHQDLSKIEIGDTVKITSRLPTVKDDLSSSLTLLKTNKTFYYPKEIMSFIRCFDLEEINKGKW